MPATDFNLEDVHGIAASPDGSIYFGDQSGTVIRRVKPDGTIVTVAGLEDQPDYNGDGMPATVARFGLRDLKVASDGGLYLADEWNSLVRRIGPDGTITRLADSGVAGGDSNIKPRFIALGGKGEVYVSGNGVVWRVDAAESVARPPAPEVGPQVPQGKRGG
jgi:streptogramin lyase